MARLVQKFGGSSVKDVEHIQQVASIIAAAARGGNQVVVVVSAMGKTTDHLIELAEQVNSKPDLREMDMLLATGEQVSIALVAMALQSLGLRSRSFTGAQAGIITDDSYGEARINEVRVRQLEAALAGGEICVVAGFQGITEHGEIATLGRGGSDTTAVALAAALKSDSCDIYSDVNGVYSADPRSISGARRLKSISYEEMFELAAGGAKVLNARSVELAMKAQVPVRLRSTFEPDDPGTLITNRRNTPEYTVCGIACDTEHVAFKLRLGGSLSPTGEYDPNGQECLSRLLLKLDKLGITKDKVTLIGPGDDQDPEFVFMVAKRQAEKVETMLAELTDGLAEQAVRIDYDIARISVVGNGLNRQRGGATAIYDTLSNASIPVKMVTTSDIRVTAIVANRFMTTAIEHIHERFCIYPPLDSRVFS